MTVFSFFEGLTEANDDTRKNVDQMAVDMRNAVRVHPPTLATSQYLILRYLTPMGEYQEFISHVFENRALYLIFSLIENLHGKDTGLAFEALKYLASLLCHKKFSLDFINHGGLEVNLLFFFIFVFSFTLINFYFYSVYCRYLDQVLLLPVFQYHYII